jgi:hypothetical protein
MGTVGCSQTLVRNYHSMLHNIPKEWKSQFWDINYILDTYQWKILYLHEQVCELELKNVGNTALEGFACKSSDSYASSTVPRIQCPACFYVTWIQNSFTDFWCSFLLSKHCSNEYVLYLHSIQFDTLTQFKVTIPVLCDNSLFNLKFLLFLISHLCSKYSKCYIWYYMIRNIY